MNHQLLLNYCCYFLPVCAHITTATTYSHVHNTKEITASAEMAATESSGDLAMVHHKDPYENYNYYNNHLPWNPIPNTGMYDIGLHF